MAKGPNTTKTGARSTRGGQAGNQTDAEAGGKARQKASAQASAQSKAKRKAKTGANTGANTGAKASLKRTSKPASKSAHAGPQARGASSASQSADVSKAALREAFEKAMQGRGLDEAEAAFDDALDDLYGFDDPARDAIPPLPEEGLPNSGEMGSLLDFYSRMLHAGGGSGDDALNDMTQSFGMVLGSGPAFAALESMLSNVSAQGAVLMNAVQTQRQLDQIGLCCTSECVKQLMSLNTGYEND